MLPGTQGANASATSPISVCGNASILTGPTTAPAGAVIVPAGNNANQGYAPNKTYYFATGVHKLAGGNFGQIIPATNDKFIGAPGAIIDGQGANNAAFTQGATGVVIQYLTIQNFASPQDQGVVNHDSGNNWIISNNTIQNNTGGAAMMAGAHQIVYRNCLKNNGQYGINAYQAANKIVGLDIDSNEIVGNAPNGDPGCGCSGGMKLWSTTDTNVIHNNIANNGSTGVWADTNNVGTNINDNYIANNANEGIFYEISYNANITNNVIIGNGLVKGPTNPGFPTGAIYISESGSDSRIGDRYTSTTNISGNKIDGNWSGVILWENADRFCTSAVSGNVCVVTSMPGTITFKTCNKTNLHGTTVGNVYYDNCRWKTQNVSVHNNELTALVKTGCTASKGCNKSGLFSNYGTFPSWSPYQQFKIEDAITKTQNNVFDNNTYNGAWSFVARDQGTTVTKTVWQSTYGQDVHSVFN